MLRMLRPALGVLRVLRQPPAAHAAHAPPGDGRAARAALASRSSCCACSARRCSCCACWACWAVGRPACCACCGGGLGRRATVVERCRLALLKKLTSRSHRVRHHRTLRWPASPARIAGVCRGIVLGSASWGRPCSRRSMTQGPGLASCRPAPLGAPRGAGWLDVGTGFAPPCHQGSRSSRLRSLWVTAARLKRIATFQAPLIPPDQRRKRSTTRCCHAVRRNNAKAR